MLRALLLASLGLGSFLAVYAALPPAAPEATPLHAGGAGAAPPPQAAGLDAAARAGDELRRSRLGEEPEAAAVVRNVTPPTITAPPAAAEAPTRAAPTSETPATAARPTLLFNVIVLSAGTLKAGDRTIHLAGVAAPEFKRRCGAAAAAWPCGRMARAALRRLIRGRAVECDLPAGMAGAVAARCRVAGEDLSAWLVAQGWAADGEEHAAAEAAAREARLGLWGDGRPDAQADLAASN
jgi:endonuclease YncB( thermonuclease family)